MAPAPEPHLVSNSGDAARGGQPSPVPAVPEALDAAARARVRCVHAHAATEVEADGIESEEEEVAGAEAPDAPAGPDLPARVVRQGDSEVAVHVRDEPRAVESAPRRHAAVAVRDPDERPRVPCHAHADVDPGM